MRDVVIALGFAFVPVAGLLLVLYANMRARALKAEQLVHDLTVVPALRAGPRQRDVADVGAAIEALTLEVERIAEGQRFTTRLLSESRNPAITRSERDAHGRSVTPH
jgi:membrane glycosyltransferase